jgi:hypothetical protein
LGGAAERLFEFFAQADDAAFDREVREHAESQNQEPEQSHGLGL